MFEMILKVFVEVGLIEYNYLVNIEFEFDMLF